MCLQPQLWLTVHRCLKESLQQHKAPSVQTPQQRNINPPIPTSSSNKSNAPGCHFIHTSPIFLLNKTAFYWLLPSHSTIKEMSAHRDHIFETQGLTLVMGIRKRRGQISRALPDWYLPNWETMGFFSASQAPWAAMIDSEIYPFPKRLLKRKNFLQSWALRLLSYSLISPTSYLKRTFAYIKFQKHQRDTHSHTNKIPWTNTSV